MMIIGAGNEFRRDDALGLFAVRRLRKLGVVAEERQGDLITLMDRWKSADGLILIDAIVSGSPPGALHRVDASTRQLDPEFFKNSTHALSIADAVELSRTLGSLPPRVFVMGVEARDLTPGVGLSPEVETILPILLEEVLALVSGPRDA